MVRKWSYITNNNFHFFSKNTLFNKYNFKIFRKNTRFKNINQSNTAFVRKLVVLKNRRVGWKPYIVISSSWVNQNLKLNKLVNFYQLKLLFNFTVNYVYSKMLISKTNQLLSIGNGALTINYNIHTSIIIVKSTNRINICRQEKLLNTAHFTKLDTFVKLNNLGMPFTTISYLRNKYHINSTLVNLKNWSITNYFNFLLKSVINMLVCLRFLHTYSTLFFLKRLGS
jgi:hypothetical protein